MAVKGQKAKNVGVKKKATKKPATKIEYKYYEPKTQGGASEAGVKNPKSIKGVKSILTLYKPNKTGSIPANQVTKLKQQRATEASTARKRAYQGVKELKVSKSGKRKLVPVSEARIKSTQVRSKKATALISTGERAPDKGIGKYRTVQPAPSSTLGRRDYRKDFRTAAGVERRNKQVFTSRQNASIKSARKKKK